MIEEVREFLGLFEGEPFEPRQRLQALAKALDKLACAYHETGPVTNPGLYSVDKNSNYEAARSVVIRYFPDFGFYPVISPLCDITSPPSMADAVDDLADIRTELLEASRLWEGGLTSDAEAHFRLSYEYHWGRHHLPGLRHYVSSQIFEY
jgi:hypothetical protein